MIEAAVTASGGGVTQLLCSVARHVAELRIYPMPILIILVCFALEWCEWFLFFCLVSGRPARDALGLNPLAAAALLPAAWIALVVAVSGHGVEDPPPIFMLISWGVPLAAVVTSFGQLTIRALWRWVEGHEAHRPAIGLCCSKSVETGHPFAHSLATCGLVDHHSVSMKEVNYVFPLLLYPESSKERAQVGGAVFINWIGFLL